MRTPSPDSPTRRVGRPGRECAVDAVGDGGGPGLLSCPLRAVRMGSDGHWGCRSWRQRRCREDGQRFFCVRSRDRGKAPRRARLAAAGVEANRDACRDSVSEAVGLTDRNGRPASDSHTGEQVAPWGEPTFSWGEPARLVLIQWGEPAKLLVRSTNLQIAWSVNPTVDNRDSSNARCKEDCF